MEFIVVSVRDEISNLFQSLTLEVNPETAVRNFRSALSIAQERKDGLLYSNPSDFALYQLGSFDSTSGVFTSIVPQLLHRGE